MLETKYVFTAATVCFILFCIHICAAVLLEERRFSIKKTFLLWIIAGVVFFFVVYFCYSLLPSSVRLAVSLLIAFLYFWATFLYASADGLWKKCYLWVTYGTIFCILWPISVMLSKVLISPDQEILAYLLRALLQFCFCIPLLLLYRKYVRPLIREVSGFHSTNWLRLFVSSIVYFLLFLILMTLMSGENWTNKTLTILFFLNICAFCASTVVSISIIYYMRKESRDEAVRQNMEYVVDYVENVKQKENEIKRFRHDVHHHNEHIVSLAREGNCEEILKYLGSHDEWIQNQSSWCPNIVVNGILSSYEAKAKEKGVEFVASADTPAHSKIKDVDYVSILANLLENALIATVKINSQGPISVDIRSVGEKVVIVVANPSFSFKLENGLPVNRSIGIDSITTTARKYQGEVNYSLDNDICSCCVVLNP